MKLLKKICFGVIITCLFSCFNNNGSECRKFCRGGVFETVGESGQTIFKENVHIETFEDNSNRVISEIYWLSDCVYCLKVKKITFEHPFIKVGDSMYVEILKIENNKMNYIANYKGVEILDSLIKIDPPSPPLSVE